MNETFDELIESICRRRGMYVCGGSFFEVCAYIAGYAHASPDCPLGGDGWTAFNEFVCATFGFPGNYTWPYAIKQCCSDDDRASERLRELLTEFAQRTKTESHKEIVEGALSRTRDQEEGEPEKTWRKFSRAVLGGKRMEIEPLIQEHPDADVLWAGAYPDDVATQEKLNGQSTYQLAGEKELRVVGDGAEAKKEAFEAPLLLRFVWFSDVQLRQREVKLFSKRTSATLDNIIPSFEHNFVQEDFDWAVYLSLIAATNRLHRDKPLDFMIHTGDAIDAGTVEELYQFVYISDILLIPWLNLVGNHDIAIFGNYKERVSYTRQAGVNFYPIGSVGSFVWMHRKERLISGFGRHLLPVPSEHGHPASEDDRAGKKLPPTYHHGFDLIIEKRDDGFTRKNLDYEKVSGYYATDLCNTAIPVRLIAMNTAKTSDWGADAYVDESQRTWLQKSLLRSDKGINIVFSHHRPDGFDKRTKEILSASGPASLVMFTGHTHRHNLKRHGDENGQAYYELNNGSVLEYPQIGRLIELRGTPQGKIWLISRALWSSPMAVGDMPSRSEAKLFLQDCHDHREAKRHEPVEAVQCGHIGALEDYWSDKKKVWGRPQSFDDAWKNANVILPIRN